MGHLLHFRMSKSDYKLQPLFSAISILEPRLRGASQYADLARRGSQLASHLRSQHALFDSSLAARCHTRRVGFKLRCPKERKGDPSLSARGILGAVADATTAFGAFAKRGGCVSSANSPLCRASAASGTEPVHHL
jgi:hypothetical protein